MSQYVVNIGTVSGDHTGDDGRTVMAGFKANFAELYAAIPGLTTKLSVTITAASTNNYSPDASWPTSCGRVDFNPTTNDIILTGLVAGTDGQSCIWRNVGTTYNGIFNIEDSNSTAANRFHGQGGAGATVVVPPYGILVMRYYALATPRWALG